MVFAALSVGRGAAWAGEAIGPLVTDRPDFTESVPTIPRGRAQLEGGLSSTWSAPGTDHALGELLLRVGTSSRLELRIGLNSFVVSEAGGSTSGLEDGSLGLKVGFWPGHGIARAWPDAAVILATTLPTGGSNVGERVCQPEAKLCLGWQPSEVWSVASNLNLAWASAEGHRFAEGSASLSVSRPLSGRLAGYLETFGFAPLEAGLERTGFVNGGVTWSLSDDVQLDGRLGLGLGSSSDDGFVGVGFARRW
jgi:hypothetical protein